MWRPGFTSLHKCAALSRYYCISYNRSGWRLRSPPRFLCVFLIDPSGIRCFGFFILKSTLCRHAAHAQHRFTCARIDQDGVGCSWPQTCLGTSEFLLHRRIDMTFYLTPHDIKNISKKAVDDLFEKIGPCPPNLSEQDRMLHLAARLNALDSSRP